MCSYNLKHLLIIALSFMLISQAAASATMFCCIASPDTIADFKHIAATQQAIDVRTFHHHTSDITDVAADDDTHADHCAADISICADYCAASLALPATMLEVAPITIISVLHSYTSSVTNQAAVLLYRPPIAIS